MDLLERDGQIVQLEAVLTDVESGAGRVVLVSGEAGVGKTSLVETFVAPLRQAGRVLWGTCDALFTPRPLGPLYDLAAQLPDGELQRQLDAGTGRGAVLRALLDVLAGPPARVVVVEDAHWADEATVDALTYVGRRIHQTRSLLVVTYRDDELGPEHPLRWFLGDLRSRSVVRLGVQPLSEAAVVSLAERAGRQPAGLYATTGGNPFFVTEVLASEGGVPATVRDAVMARSLRLSPEARDALETVSVVPTRADRSLLDAMLQAGPAIDECIASGMLRADGDGISFRHELSRRAIEESLPAGRRRALHAAVLEALTSRPGGIALARLVHHADGSGASPAVLRFAPEAARQAARLGAHREAVSHYETALRHADAAAAPDRAALLEGCAHEYYLTSRIQEALEAGEEALGIWRETGNPVREAEMMRRLSRVVWFLGAKDRADAYATGAVRVLERLPPSPALAMAYSNLSQQHMNACEAPEALRWGHLAMDLAIKFGDSGILAHALNNIGNARVQTGDQAGWNQLQRSLEVSIEHDLTEHAARAYVNFGKSAQWLRESTRAIEYLEAGLAYCNDRDMSTNALCMVCTLGLARLRLGDWAGAEEDASSALGSGRLPPVDRIPPLTVLGLVRARRGDPGVWDPLDEARRLAWPSRELYWLTHVASARAEAAWLEGRLDEVVDDLLEVFGMATERGNAWAVGELGFWLWRATAVSEPPVGAAKPFALQMNGDWRAAADAWMALRCPYERAMALGQGDAPAMKEALAVFESLGATPAADMIRGRMREEGVLGVPRGPRPATKAHPAGLTERQGEVLALLAEGLTNSEIADRLFITAKTADHHVSAVLGKLGARSRTEAAAMAVREGLLDV